MGARLSFCALLAFRLLVNNICSSEALEEVRQVAVGILALDPKLTFSTTTKVEVKGNNR